MATDSETRHSQIDKILGQISKEISFDFESKFAQILGIPYLKNEKLINEIKTLMEGYNLIEMVPGLGLTNLYQISKDGLEIVNEEDGWTKFQERKRKERDLIDQQIKLGIITNQSIIQTNESIRKTNDSVVATNESIIRTNESVDTTNQSVVQTNQSIVRTNTIQRTALIISIITALTATIIAGLGVYVAWRTEVVQKSLFERLEKLELNQKGLGDQLEKAIEISSDSTQMND